ncbi:MAG: PspC domain-containing protein [Pedobacter sp.]|nr:MAG: PspC domain-containing protein [Pedobacter sp.]
MEKRLFRNEYEKVLGGVSSGIAEYMEVDVTIVRLLFVLSTIFLVGTGVLVYLVMWIVVPVNNDPAKRFAKFNDFNKGFSNPFEQKSNSQGWTSSSMHSDPFKMGRDDAEFRPLKKSSETGKTVAGLVLLVMGIYFLMNEFNIIPFWFNVGKMWPLVFVAIGASFLLKAKNKNTWADWKREQEKDAMFHPKPAEDTVVTGSSTAEAPVASGSTVTETPIVTGTPGAEVPIVTETTVTDSPIVTDTSASEKPKVDDRFTKKDI